MSQRDRRRDARRRGRAAPAPASPSPSPSAEPVSAPAPAPAAAPTSPRADAPPPEHARRRALALAGLGLVAVVLGVAAILRLWDLPLAPFHNDEGVNGWFTSQLLRTGQWAYDPANYHGPTLFYAAALSGLLVGLGDVSMRLVPAVFGLATLGLVLLAGRWIGRAGAIAAVALLAVSPGMVFFSRYAIHEMLLVFFTLAFVLAAARWWESGRTRFLLAAAAALAAMFATKETAVITVVTLALAAACVPAYERLAPRILRRPTRFEALPAAAAPPVEPARRTRRVDPTPYARFGGRDRLVRSLAAAAAVFAVVWVTLFSSLFTNPAGIVDSLRSLAIWTQTSGATQVSGPLTYLGWMVEEELPLLVVGLAASAWAAWEGRSRFAIFAAAWATGLFLGYSLIGYKTPWLMLSWLLPYALVGGYALGRAWANPRPLVRLGAAAAVAGAFALSLVQAVQLSFRDYDDEANAYVYVQTQRDTLDLVRWLREEDERRGAGGEMGIVIMSPDYWPLPWYLRDDPKAGFYGSIVDVEAPVQVVKADQVDALPTTFTDRYREQARYTLRPGVELVVFVERDA